MNIMLSQIIIVYLTNKWFMIGKLCFHRLIFNLILLRERPFNLKGGGVCFFSKKNILIPNVAEKNILILMEEKKNNLIQSFCHIT